MWSALATNTLVLDKSTVQPLVVPAAACRPSTVRDDGKGE